MIDGLNLEKRILAAGLLALSACNEAPAPVSQVAPTPVVEVAQPEEIFTYVGKNSRGKLVYNFNRDSEVSNQTQVQRAWKEYQLGQITDGTADSMHVIPIEVVNVGGSSLESIREGQDVYILADEPVYGPASEHRFDPEHMGPFSVLNAGKPNNGWVEFSYRVQANDHFGTIATRFDVRDEELGDHFENTGYANVVGKDGSDLGRALQRGEVVMLKARLKPEYKIY